MTVHDALRRLATPAPALTDYEPVYDAHWDTIGWTITHPDGTGHLPRCAHCNAVLDAHPDKGLARHRLYRHWDLVHTGAGAAV